MKLYVRDEIVEIKALVLELMNTLHSLMKEHIHTYMPGFTHLQKAQPITLAHHFGAYMEMFKRDYGRLCDIYARMNYCPLGSGALAGTTYPLDRELTASFLTLQVLPLTVWTCRRPRLLYRIIICTFNDYDASEPFLRGDHYLEYK